MPETSSEVFVASGRRVITGHDPSGHSTFFEDAYSGSRMEVPGAVSLVDLWRMEKIPAAFDNNDSAIGAPILNPPPHGLIARLVGIPPASEHMTEELASSAFDQMGGAATHQAGPGKHPGMHKTPTIDLIYVVSGEVYAVLDEGEKLLKPGDLLVQRGTSHAWDNRSDKTCYMFAVLIGAGGADD